MTPQATLDEAQRGVVASAREGVSSPGVVILCPNAWSVRNMIHAGTVSKLRAEGVRVEVLVRNPSSDAAQTDCDVETHTTLHDCRTTKRVRGKALFDEVLRLSFNTRYHLRSYRIFDAWHRRSDGPALRMRARILRRLTSLTQNDPVFRWQRSLEGHLLRRTYNVARARQQLAALRPTLVVSTSCVDGIEWPYLLAARDLGVPTMGCILSFDNLTSRGALPEFDFYAVWNARMRAEVRHLYSHCESERIYITGTPQFDFHHQPGCRWDRLRTLRHLGLEHDDRYVVYAANSASLTPSEPLLVKEFAHHLAEHPSCANHRIVVRLHPLDEFERWQDVELGSKVVISRPWRHSDGTLSAEDQACLVSTLLHSDVCINIASTITLDAAVLDVPVVCPMFAVSDDPAERQFVAALYDTDHFAPIARQGAVQLARDSVALAGIVAAYVNDPARDRALRARLCAEESGWLGSAAAPRLAQRIAAVVRDASGHQAFGNGRSTEESQSR